MLIFSRFIYLFLKNEIFTFQNFVSINTQPWNMLMICLNFQESQPKYAYKLYAYKKKGVAQVPSTY